MSVEKRNITIWYGRMEDAEPFMDLAYWLGESTEAKFETAWKMVVEAHAIRRRRLE